MAIKCSLSAYIVVLVQNAVPSLLGCVPSTVQVPVKGHFVGVMLQVTFGMQTCEQQNGMAGQSSERAEQAC